MSTPANNGGKPAYETATFRRTETESDRIREWAELQGIRSFSPTELLARGDPSDPAWSWAAANIDEAIRQVGWPPAGEYTITVLVERVVDQ